MSGAPGGPRGGDELDPLDSIISTLVTSMSSETVLPPVRRRGVSNVKAAMPGASSLDAAESLAASLVSRDRGIALPKTLEALSDGTPTPAAATTTRVEGFAPAGSMVDPSMAAIMQAVTPAQDVFQGVVPRKPPQQQSTPAKSGASTPGISGQPSPVVVQRSPSLKIAATAPVSMSWATEPQDVDGMDDYGTPPPPPPSSAANSGVSTPGGSRDGPSIMATAPVAPKTPLKNVDDGAKSPETPAAAPPQQEVQPQQQKPAQDQEHPKPQTSAVAEGDAFQEVDDYGAPASHTSPPPPRTMPSQYSQPRQAHQTTPTESPQPVHPPDVSKTGNSVAASPEPPTLPPPVEPKSEPVHSPSISITTAPAQPEPQKTESTVPTVVTAVTPKQPPSNPSLTMPTSVAQQLPRRGSSWISAMPKTKLRTADSTSSADAILAVGTTGARPAPTSPAAPHQVPAASPPQPPVGASETAKPVISAGPEHAPPSAQQATPKPVPIPNGQGLADATYPPATTPDKGAAAQQSAQPPAEPVQPATSAAATTTQPTTIPAAIPAEPIQPVTAPAAATQPSEESVQPATSATATTQSTAPAASQPTETVQPATSAAATTQPTAAPAATPAEPIQPVATPAAAAATTPPAETAQLAAPAPPATAPAPAAGSLTGAKSVLHLAKLAPIPARPPSQRTISQPWKRALPHPTKKRPIRMPDIKEEHVDLAVEFRGSQVTVSVPTSSLSNVEQLRALIGSHCQSGENLKIEVYSDKLKQFVDLSDVPFVAPTAACRATVIEEKLKRPGVPSGNTEGVHTLVKLSKACLFFGFESQLAPLDVELRDTVAMENISSSIITFRTESISSPSRFSLRLEPNNGSIRPHDTVTFNVVLVLSCTTKFEIIVPLIVESAVDDITATPPLVIRVVAKPSTKLDFEELRLTNPPVGSGSSGTVFKALWRGQDVSVKQLFAQGLDAEFAKEVALLDKLRSPYIVTFIGAVHVPGKFCIVTEFLPLGSMLTAMEKKKFSNPLQLKCALDCAHGLVFLHSSGVAHRSVKPENLLMVSLRLDAPVSCKLTDFKNPNSKSVDPPDGVVPRPIYIAPEVLEKNAFSPASDAYSWGMVLYFLRLGTVPYQSVEFPTPASIAQFVRAGKRLSFPPDCPQPVQEAIGRCWAQSPSERPPLQDMVGLLAPVFESEKAMISSSKGGGDAGSDTGDTDDSSESS